MKKRMNEVGAYAFSDQEKDKIHGIFVARDEKYIASLGNGYIASFLAKGILGMGFAIVSDKRVYFKGSCLTGKGKNFVISNEERTVDTTDITGSGFIFRNKVGGPIFGMVMSIFGMLLGVFVLSIYFEYEKMIYSILEIESNFSIFSPNCLIGLCLIGVSSLFFFLSLFYLRKAKKTYFEIQYAGGKIAFDVSFYAKAEIDEFQKQLRLAKDIAIMQKNQAVSAVPLQTPAVDVTENLKKYAEMLKNGLISQEEYEALKKKLLGL